MSAAKHRGSRVLKLCAHKKVARPVRRHCTDVPKHEMSVEMCVGPFQLHG